MKGESGTFAGINKNSGHVRALGKEGKVWKNKKDQSLFIDILMSRMENPKTQEEKNTVNNLFYEIGGIRHCVVDKQVYSIFQALKLPYQTKFGSQRCMIPINPTGTILLADYLFGVYSEAPFFYNHLPSMQKTKQIQTSTCPNPGQGVQKKTISQHRALKFINGIGVIPEGTEINNEEELNLFRIPCPGLGYGEWFAAACAAKHGDISFDLFSTWSKQDIKYDPQQTRNLWDSIVPRQKQFGHKSLLRWANEANEASSWEPAKNALDKPEIRLFKQQAEQGWHANLIDIWSSGQAGFKVYKLSFNNPKDECPSCKIIHSDMKDMTWFVVRFVSLTDNKTVINCWHCCPLETQRTRSVYQEFS